MANEEPGYLKALREQQNRKRGGAPSVSAGGQGRGAPTPAEREAVKWARETSGKEPQISASVSGARYAVLFKPASIDGRAPIVLDGVASRDALVERLKEAEAKGQEVLGCYDVQGGRALTVEKSEGQITFKAGEKREVAKAMSPDQMIRRAQAQAAELAKSRKFDDRGPGRGGPGRGGPGGGRGGSGRGGQGGGGRGSR